MAIAIGAAFLLLALIVLLRHKAPRKIGKATERPVVTYSGDW